MKYILIGRGKMGKLIRETASAAGDEIQAAFGHDDLDQLGRLGKVADVVIDFSRPEALPEIASYVRRTGTPLLSGTTGYTPRDMELIRSLGTAAPVLWSANFSLGVAVLYRALQTVSGVLKPDFDIEITETHHNQKADAPSGTAKLLVEALDPQHCGRYMAGRATAASGRRTKSASTPCGAALWPAPTRSTSSAPTRSWSSPTGPPAVRSSSTVPCTWPGCCRESPMGSMICKKSCLESDYERPGNY